MKKITLLTLMVAIATISFCQKKETPIQKIYLQSGTGLSSHNGIPVEFGIQAVIKNNWTATLSYTNINMDPKNLPKDYDPGGTFFLFIPIAGETPSVDLKLISFTVGKYFPTGGKTWVTTEAGLSYVQGKEFKFSKNNQTSGFGLFPLIADIPANYTTTEEKKSTVGAMLKADFNWAFASFAGLGAGVFANINSINSPVGFQIKLLVGKMNRQKRS